MFKQLFKNDTEFVLEDSPAEPVRKHAPYKGRRTRKQQLLDEVKQDGTRSNKEYSETIGITDTYVSVLINEMKRSGTVRVNGSAAAGNRVIEPVAEKVYSKRKQTKQTKPNRVRRKRMKNGEPKKRVYEYIARHNGKRLLFSDIKRDTGVCYASIYRVIEQLEEDNKILRSTPGEDGRKYWLYEAVQVDKKNQKPKASETERTDTTTPRNGGAVMELLDELVMEFVQETRSTNVLEFLNWLERLEKLK